jgi:hypothetical protein
VVLPQVDALTRCQKDTILARSGIPLTGAIERATEAADAASTQAAGHDSLLRQTGGTLDRLPDGVRPPEFRICAAH